MRQIPSWPFLIELVALTRLTFVLLSGRMKQNASFRRLAVLFILVVVIGRPALTAPAVFERNNLTQISHQDDGNVSRCDCSFLRDIYLHW